MHEIRSFLSRILTRRQVLKTGFFGVVALIWQSPSRAATSPISFELVGTPSSTSAQILVRTTQTLKVFVEYGLRAGSYNTKSGTVTIVKGSSSNFDLNNLKSNTKYFFRIRYAVPTAKTFSIKTGTYFTTAVASSKFIFAIQADPHMDENSDPIVYSKTLEQVVAASPAFFMDLGDIFMVDKLQVKSESNIRARYQLMKDYYSKLGNIPLKITLGNHDGELGYSNFNTKNYRKEYFPEQTGELAYYSFSGPDQLHIVLDPFTYTTSNPKIDGWQWTLGKTQYDWLRSTLEGSKATHKFIYIHHLLVGDAQSRGGVEIAMYNEWGGKNKDGSEGFNSNRAGWGKPIHQLLLDNKVGFVFKGHDHLYVKQELDGIIYQTLPQPSHPGEKLDVTQYGYLSGKAVGGSGYLRVTTEGKVVTVDFIKFDGSLGDSYTRSAF